MKAFDHDLMTITVLDAFGRIESHEGPWDRKFQASIVTHTASIDIETASLIIGALLLLLHDYGLLVTGSQPLNHGIELTDRHSMSVNPRLDILGAELFSRDDGARGG